jgi:hypothetical protein
MFHVESHGHESPRYRLVVVSNLPGREDLAFGPASSLSVAGNMATFSF